MRATAKRSSIPDIRTTGFVQLDASRPEKRLKCDEWDPLTFESNLSETHTGFEAEFRASGHADQQQVASQTSDAKGEAGGVKAQGDPHLEEQAPLEKKIIRHCSRRKSRKCSDASRSRMEDRTSDALEMDLHQLPEDRRCIADDESMDTREDMDSRLDYSISGSESTRKDDLDEVEDCLNFLEQFGLFKDTCWIDNGEQAPEDPGYVGDGIIVQNCKVCGRPENVSGTLICDICEGTFHVACCYPKVRSLPRDDRWFCGFCARKRRKKSAELKVYPAGQLEEKFPGTWKIDRTKTRGWDLQRLDRTHVRIGTKYQAEVPLWTGKVVEILSPGYFGQEIPRSLEEKLKEKELAEENLAKGILPNGWLPVTRLPEGEKENWLQCQNVLHEEGDKLPDGTLVTKDTVCGKWRRAPLHIVADEGWECSCAIVWDPRHADCAVPQELPIEEIRKRPKAKLQSPFEVD